MSNTPSTAVSTIGVHPFSQTVIEQSFPANNARVRRYISFFPDSQSLSSVFSENQKIVDMSHPDVIPFLKVEMEDSKMCLVRPYIHGSSLSELLYETGAQSRQFALSVTLSISKILSIMHGRGMTAANLKAENVIVGPSDGVKLVDLGISAFYYETVSDSSTILSCVFAGPRCVSEGCAKPSKELDIFNLGIILYAILVGRLPWKVYNMVRIMNQIMHDSIPIPRTIDEDLQLLLKDMFSCCAEKRPTADELVKRITVMMLEKTRTSHRENEEVNELQAGSVRSRDHPEMLFRKDSSYDQLANYKRSAVLGPKPLSGKVPAVRSRVLKGIKPRQVPVSASTFITHVHLT